MIDQTVMYLVKGQRYCADDCDLAVALLSAHENGTRPLCLCTGTGVPVYVSRVADRLVAKRLPFSGHLHAPDCPHYGRTDTEDRVPAICRDPATGLTQVHLAFSLLKRKSNFAAELIEPTVRATRHSNAARQGIDLRELLLLLWQEADLMRWHPSFEGKRTWRVVRNHLLAAAERVMAGRRRLSDLIFVPEVFSIGQRDQICARRRRLFAETFDRGTSSRQMRMLIAEVKRIVVGPTACAAVFKHIPDIQFDLHAGASQDLLRIWKPTPVWLERHPLAIATFFADWTENPAIDALALIPMNARWLPSTLAQSGRCGAVD